MAAVPATSRKRKSPEQDKDSVQDENKLTVEQWLHQRCEKQVEALQKRAGNMVKRLRSEFDEVSKVGVGGGQTPQVSSSMFMIFVSAKTLRANTLFWCCKLHDVKYVVRFVIENMPLPWALFPLYCCIKGMQS